MLNMREKLNIAISYLYAAITDLKSMRVIQAYEQIKDAIDALVDLRDSLK